LLLRDLVADLLALKNHAAVLGHCTLQHEMARAGRWVSTQPLLSVVCRACEGRNRCHKHGSGCRGNKELPHDAPPFFARLGKRFGYGRVAKHFKMVMFEFCRSQIVVTSITNRCNNVQSWTRGWNSNVYWKEN
jgi:hypothetical protein